MSLEVLSARFEAHEKECTQDKLSFISDIKDLRTEIKTKISKQNFWTIFSLLVTLVLAMFGYIAARIDSMSEKTGAIQSDVSFLNGFIKNKVEFIK